MSASKSIFGTLHPFAGAEQEALYETLGGFLQGLLVRKFEMPHEDAVSLVHETFVVYYALGVPVPNERAWLISAACRMANAWLQKRGLPPGDEADIARNAGKALSHRDAVELLPERAREALRLRFAEQKSYEEIAKALGVSTFWAQRIVGSAVARLRGLLRGEGSKPAP